MLFIDLLTVNNILNQNMTVVAFPTINEQREQVTLNEMLDFIVQPH